MKTTSKLLTLALAASGLALAPAAFARDGGASHGGGQWSAAHSGHQGGHWSGGTRTVNVHGGGHVYRGGPWYGHRGGYYGSRWYGPSWGFTFGVPVFWGPYWGTWYDYPRETVVYREVVAEPGTLESIRELPDGTAEQAGTIAPPPAANPLSVNYCASAKAYFPTVRSCPEGWAVTPPTR